MHPFTVGQNVTKFKEREAAFVAAPVFGGQGIAVDGKLVFAIGGDRQAVGTVTPLIRDVMGRKVVDVGEDATRAALIKIAGCVNAYSPFPPYCKESLLMMYRNIVTLNMMEAVGEAQVFAERTGLGTGPMEEVIGEAFGPVAGGYSKRCAFIPPTISQMHTNTNHAENRLTTGAYAPPLDAHPGFGVSLSIKDAKHAASMAKDDNVELPGLKIAQENMEAAREYAGECLDSSSMYGILRQKAGLEFWNEKSRKGGS